MRILFFLEPVIFGTEADAVASHFVWTEYFRDALAGTEDEMAVCGNDETCQRWIEHCGAKGDSAVTFALNAFEVLADFGSDRTAYVAGARCGKKGKGAGKSYLEEELSRIEAVFRPDAVVLSLQNVVVERAFKTVPKLFLEQPPLPRRGYPFRTVFDPCGHQAGAMISDYAQEIQKCAQGTTLDRSLALLADLRSRIEASASEVPDAGEVIADIANGRRVAILATQPRDVMIFGGGGQADLTIEDVLFKWASQLPDGWVGIPTFHVGQSLPESMERSIERSSSKIAFLPQNISRAQTELLLPFADGLVTVSSSVAMTALLHGLRVVATGSGRYKGWCATDVSKIDEQRLIDDNGLASLLCFLTHRYCEDHDDLTSGGFDLRFFMHELVSGRRGPDWFLDVADWDVERARALLFGDNGDSVEGRSAIVAKLGDRIQNLKKSLDVSKASQVELRTSLKRAVEDHQRAVDDLEVEALRDREARGLAEDALKRRDADIANLRSILAAGDKLEAGLKAQLANEAQESARLRDLLSNARLEEMQTRSALAHAQSELQLEREAASRAQDVQDRASRAQQASWDAERNASEGRYDDLQVRVLELITERDQILAQLRDAALNRDEVWENLASALVAVAALEQSVEAAEARRAEVAHELSALKVQHREAGQAFELEIARRDVQISEGGTRVAALIAEVSELRLMLGEALTSSKAANAQIDALNAQLATLERDLARAADTIRDGQSLLERSEKAAADERDRHGRDIAALSETLDLKREEAESLARQLQDTRSDLSDRDAELAEVKTLHQRLGMQVEEAEDARQILSAKFDSQSVELMETASALATATEQTASLSEAIREFEVRTAALHALVDEARRNPMRRVRLVEDLSGLLPRQLDHEGSRTAA